MDKVIKRFLLSLFLLSAFLPVPDALAASPAARKAGTNLPAAPTPFGLVLGKTTYADAAAIADAEGATLKGRGNGDAKPSYGDNDPDGVANPRVVLADFAGLPLDNLEIARMGFFDDALYFIRYTFKQGADFDKLRKQLDAKYGPGRRLNQFGQMDATYVWQFQGVEMTLKDDFMNGDTLIFIQYAIAAKVAASHKQVYDEHIRKKAKAQRGR